MVNTRSQARSSIPVFMSKASRNDRVSDTESECSIPDLLTRDQIDELDNENRIHSEQHPDQVTIDQRFSSMNRQINELTGLVLALTEKLSSNHGEGNDQNAVTDKPSARSDMVTGVPQTNFLANPHPTQQSTSRYPQPPASQFDDIVSEIHHLRDTMTDTVQHPKILHTQVPLFRGNREKYNEFEHLLLNHLRPHQHKLSEEQKLTYFQSLLRDDAIEFWQSLKMTSQTTLAQVLRYFKKEYAKEDLKEVAKYKLDQMLYDPTAETFNDFLNKFKKVAKQAFGDESSDITETFLFAKLPVQMQNELAMAGKHDASMEEIRTFVQRRCQYAQLIPNTTPQPFNQISAPQHNAAEPQSSNSQPPQTGRQNENSTDNAATVESQATSGPNAVSASGRKRKTKTATTNNQLNPPTLRTSNLNTTPSWCAKYVAKWDTPPETATTEIRRRQPIEVSRILSSRPKKTSSSAATSDKLTTGSTTRTNCPTPPTMKLIMSKKRRGTMT